MTSIRENGQFDACQAIGVRNQVHYQDSIRPDGQHPDAEKTPSRSHDHANRPVHERRLGEP
jgi:hypothetical protein